MTNFEVKINNLEREVQLLRRLVYQKTGGGSSDIRTNIVQPSDIAATIGAGTIVLASLASIISPTRIVKLSGSVTWSGSGATLASSISGVLSTDLIMATISTKPTQAAYLVRATATTDTITFELQNANTSNDAVIAYTVFRATS